MIRDFQYAVRLLVKTPGFTIVAVLALALGIGASTTAFSIVNAVLLRPFPLMQNQERLVFVTSYLTKTPEEDEGLSFPDYVDIKQQTTTLEGLGVWQNTTFIITNGDTPERFLGATVTAETFSFLGVQPILGRNFRAEESELNAAPVALIGYHVWQNLFGGDASIVGRQVPINGQQVTIVGVMPRGWRFPEQNDIWMPMQFTEQEHPRGEFFLRAIGLLKEGASMSEATAELQAIGGRIASEHPATHSGLSLGMKYFREKVTEEPRALTLLIMGAVIFVHLIACVNVANLLLARGATRTREVAVRCALGASRAHIVRGLLAESLVLGFAGSILGLLFAVWGIDLMVSSIPVEVPFWITFELDWRIFSFALATGVLSSLVFGLVPALQSSKPQLVDALKEGGRSGAAGGKSQRVRNILVVAEVALALTLLIGAGLMLRSFIAIQKSDLGIDPRNTLTFRVGLPPMQFPDKADAARFFEQLLPRLGNIAGVEAAGATTSLPASGTTNTAGVVIEGDVEPQQLHDARMGNVTTITPGFLQACSIALLRGRDFGAADTAAAPRVALIDERAARMWFPNQHPIGRQIRKFDASGEERQWLTIVGVVREVVYDQRQKRRALPGVYLCAYQNPQWFLSIAMRTKSDPKAFVNVARTTVLSVNKDIPIYNIYSMEEVVAESYWEKRFFGWMFAIFAGLALFLASLGLYGVMSYSVRQRTQEIGVRIALGAQSSDVLRLVTGQGVRLILVGLVLGFFSAYFLTKLMASTLEVPPHDPVSFIVVGLLLFVVGLLACYLPARSAMRLDPIVALRHQ